MVLTPDKEPGSDLLNEALKIGAVPDGYEPVEVEFFQFKTEGDELKGRLINKLSTTIRGNKVGKYTLMQGGKKRISFLGGVHLDELMYTVPIGSEVWITFTHRERSEDTGNEIKKFKVFQKQPK